ncbi:hypothetical protein HAX54_013596 [Datura stramonium]|uniref:Cysteine proteinase inhibitor n=1 Tax=Datura stramonium TaxID=4076 RepID=A0ABS8TLI2_DATST|nr:hypothetical protein [Datura stramonium]
MSPTFKNVRLKFVNVLSAKKQIVAGTIYYITLEATDDGKKKIYDTKIWVKEWENIKEVQEFKLVSDAPKPGGIIDVPCPNDLKFADLARFVVQYYNNKKKVHLEFVNILCVKEQIVAGTIYYIKLEAIDTRKKKIYETKTWVKEWENVKEAQEFKLVESARK